MLRQFAIENLCCIYPVIGYKTFQISAADTSPVPPPRGVAVSANSQQDYCNNQCANNSVLPQALAGDLRSPNALNFEQLHERFRKLIMKDVIEYRAHREIKSKPLIEL